MKINRRNLLKSSLFSLGGLLIAPPGRTGIFADMAVTLDPAGRIFHSPLVREYFLEGITPAASPIRLDSNENPYGPPLSARKAVAEAVAGGNRYAWQEITTLIGQLARKEGVGSDAIMVGPGSSDLLERTAMAVCAHGGNVVSADPTFMSLIRVAESVGATWKAIPCKSDWSHDLGAMEKAIDSNTRLVYVCNPSNPVGTVTPTGELMDFCSRVSEKVPVFVDEAYIELADGATGSMIPLVQQQKNVIVARTFSKIMGMAGLRVGYIASLPATLHLLQKVTRGGFGISYTSVLAASAALTDQEFQDTSKKLITEVKTYLCDRLQEMGYAYIPSYTNFVIFPIPIAGKEFLGKMTAKGIAVRAFDIGNNPWCRVSIGTMDEIKQFVAALKSIT